ncbi:MAG: hypothetical protein A2675_02820 [Candidatus Yonathbacteria bacterium RIFCSPHIGHO2_01_FULL_51_10]|uniref:Uncharacterized protein n=1 Tax=Candidatus Yonathbacteria bacterium RIFCSPHIGHO2_01_FULL_51_10 TaxID=1802723 RepID=A0A1G2SAG0_9BACT|nr:MAG: hypothetical protein A2675_02820 [Candidatus Yonathbacteria bacterium RIFCSPHIGHO2_01_FULL_51_10]
MDQAELRRRFVEKLYFWHPPKWGGSHTEERNLFKGMPKHLIGRKETLAVLHELYRERLILKHVKSNEVHVSLNPEKKKEIEEIVFTQA